MHKPHVMRNRMAILRRKFHLMEDLPMKEVFRRKKALRKEGFPQGQIAYGVGLDGPKRRTKDQSAISVVNLPLPALNHLA